MKDIHCTVWFATAIDGEWTKDLTNVPCIAEEEVIDFLLHRRLPSDKLYDESSAKHAKPVKAVKFVNNGYVQKVVFLQGTTGSSCCYQSECAGVYEIDSLQSVCCSDA